MHESPWSKRASWGTWHHNVGSTCWWICLLLHYSDILLVFSNNNNNNQIRYSPCSRFSSSTLLLRAPPYHSLQCKSSQNMPSACWQSQTWPEAVIDQSVVISLVKCEIQYPGPFLSTFTLSMILPQMSVLDEWQHFCMLSSWKVPNLCIHQGVQKGNQQALSPLSPLARSLWVSNWWAGWGTVSATFGTVAAHLHGREDNGGAVIITITQWSHCHDVTATPHLSPVT